MLYRFHFDCEAFSLPDWPLLRSAVFKDAGEFKLVVLEVSKVVQKRHYQGVVSSETPKATLETRIKKHKIPDFPRGSYSLTKQKPAGVDGYYNYLCKGDEYGQLPEVLETKFSDEEIARRHENYHTKVQDTTELEKKCITLVQEYDARAARQEAEAAAKNKIPDDNTPMLRGLWRDIYQNALEYLMETNPNGFVLSQVERLSFKTLTVLIKKNENPETLVTQLPEVIAMKRAAAMI